MAKQTIWTDDSHGVELRSAGYGSDHYGACECCGKHVSETFIASSVQKVQRRDGSHFLIKSGGVYGHDACVRQAKGLA